MTIVDSQEKEVNRLRRIGDELLLAKAEEKSATRRISTTITTSSARI